MLSRDGSALGGASPGTRAVGRSKRAPVSAHGCLGSWDSIRPNDEPRIGIFESIGEDGGWGFAVKEGAGATALQRILYVVCGVEGGPH